MNDERFTLDSNILIYSLDASAGYRRERAARIIAEAMHCDCWLTLQSVSEFYAAATRKKLISRSQAAAQANDWLEMFSTVAASPNAVRSALAVATTERASYWDALLVATAAEAGCSAILTEDMSDGMSLRDVRILNPFSGDAIPAAVLQLLAAD
jgi:predicted nucleic acid-binding protein